MAIDTSHFEPPDSDVSVAHAYQFRRETATSGVPRRQVVPTTPIRRHESSSNIAVMR
jgi:hypothetical protein